MPSTPTYTPSYRHSLYSSVYSRDQYRVVLLITATLFTLVYRGGEGIPWGLVSCAVLVFPVVMVDNRDVSQHPIHFLHR